MRDMRVCAAALLLLVTVAAHPQRIPAKYEQLSGHQLWRVEWTESTRVLPQLLLSHAGVGLLQERGSAGSGGDAVIRVLPHAREDVLAALNTENIRHEVVVEDLAKYVQDHDEREEVMHLNARSETETCKEEACPEPLTHSYMSFQQMEWYLKQLQRSYSDRVELSSLGTTEEGRHIWFVTVKADKSRKLEARDDETVAWLEGGIHAREWISPATTLHLLHEIVTNCETNCDVEYHFTPMTNPDGYEYSRTHDRMWRKNRADTGDPNCKGVDLNRNWDAHYGVGSNSMKCSEVYHGPSPFSEPETRLVSEQMQKIKNLKLVVAIHSYGQSLLYPWGWTSDPIDDKPRLLEAGKAFAKSIRERKINGTKYSVINSGGGLGIASGATDDWAKEKLPVAYSYTLELPDTGREGFLLSATKIGPTAEDVKVGFFAMLDVIRKTERGNANV